MATDGTKCNFVINVFIILFFVFITYVPAITFNNYV